jgi:hypothetical protein
MLSTMIGKIRRRLNKSRDLDLRVNAIEAATLCLIESPAYVHAGEIGLNRQRVRKKIFADLADAFRFDVVIETGTWTGDTTGYLATTLGLPVYSCELHKVPHAIAKKRLADLPNVKVFLSDSRAFLRDLATKIPSTTHCLLYLDAHWHDDLPLAEELEIIVGAWKNYVVVVDDFRVPDDKGYAYDSYGRGKTLSIEDFGADFAKNGLVALFPAAPSTEETGFKRGCVVLVPKGDWATKAAGLASLRSY